MISLNPMIDCDLDLGLPNYLFIAVWVSANDASGLSVQYLICHVSVQSCRAVTDCAFFIWSYVIFCAVHTAFATNENGFGSSLPKPLKIGNFMVFDMLNNNKGGGDVGEGVCCGREGWGGMGRWGIHRKPCLIKYTTLHGEACTTPSSSLEGGSINGLYLGPVLPWFLKICPLCVDPNIKVMA